MLDKVLYFILSNFPLCMCILSLLIALTSHSKFNQRFFACLLFFAVGFGGIWGFIMHAFLIRLRLITLAGKQAPLSLK